MDDVFWRVNRTMIRNLARPDGFLFGVGDDDQSIYGYADASPDWFVDFTGAECRRAQQSQRLDLP